MVGRVPLPAEPAVTAWIRGGGVLALASGALWRIDRGAARAMAMAMAIALPWRADTLAVSPDGREAYAASAAHEEIVAIDLASGRQHTLKAPTGAIALTSDGGGAVLLGLRADDGTLFALW